MPETVSPPAPPSPESTLDSEPKTLQYNDGQMALGYNEPGSGVELGPDSGQKWARNVGEGGNDMAVIFTQQGNAIGVGYGTILDAGNRQLADMPRNTTVKLEVGKPVVLPGIETDPDDPIDAIVLRYKTTDPDTAHDGADQIGTASPFVAMRTSMEAARSPASSRSETSPQPRYSNEDSLKLIQETARKSVTAERWLAKHYQFDNPNPGELTMKVDEKGKIPLYEVDGGETPQEVYQKLMAFEGLSPDDGPPSTPEPVTAEEDIPVRTGPDHSTVAAHESAEDLSDQEEEEDVEADTFTQNLELLRSRGELGHMFADLYEEAVQAEPALADILVNVAGSDTNPTLARTGGFARHKDETTSGKYEITVNTEDGIDHYQALLSRRKRSSEVSAAKLGIAPEDFTPEQLAAFIFLHELGHIVDYTKNAPDKATCDARRQSDMAKLPVPGYNPVELAQKLGTPDMRRWFHRNVRTLKQKYNVSSFDELLKAQESAYHDVETEDIPDQFAARIMKRLNMTEPALAA